MLVAVVLVGASFWIGTDGYFFIDEGAIYAQVEVLEENDGWTVARPFAERDPDAELAPMARSHIVEGEFAPYVDHPVQVLLGRAADHVAGRAGIRLLSTAGAVVAAVGAGLIARTHGPRAAVLALWLTALTSPMVFHAQLVVGHTIGGGLAGLLAWRAFAPVRWRFDPVVLFALAAGGVLFRSEFVLLTAAVVAVAVVGHRRRPVLGTAVPAAAMVGGAALAYVGEPAMIRAMVGGDAGATVISSSSRGGLSGVLEGARTALFEPTLAASVESTTGAAVLLAGVLVAVAVWTLRRAETSADARFAALSAAGALVAGLLFVRAPDIVPGLLPAFPAIWLLIGLRRSDLDRPVALAAAATLLYGLLVVSTQYRVVGGGVEWGWRYFAVALPLLAPAMAVAVLSMWDRNQAPGRVALGFVVTASLLVPLGGLRSQKQFLESTEAFLDRTLEGAADADFVVTTDPSFGRFAYRLSIEGRLALARDGGQPVLAWLAHEGADEVLMVWRGPEPDLDLAPYRRSGQPIALGSGYSALPLRPSNARSP